MSDACSIAVGYHTVAVGGADGVVRLYRTRSLQLDAILPLPGGGNVLSPRSDKDATDVPLRIQHAAVSVALSSIEDSLTVLYADGSTYCWDIERKDEITVEWSTAPHAACIWDVATRHTDGSASGIATACEDGSVRLWRHDSRPKGAGKLTPRRSAALLTPRRRKAQQPRTAVLQAGRIKLPAAMPLAGCPRPQQADVEASPKSPLRCAVARVVTFSSCGKRLAIGDDTGTLHVHDADTHALLARRAAHDGAVRRLAYCAQTRAGVSLLASAGADGLVHVFDATHDDYSVLQSLNEHEGLDVTAAIFAGQRCGIVTAARDGSVCCRCAEPLSGRAVVA